MATLKDESVVGLSVAFGDVVRGRGERVSERVAETSIADKHILCIVWKVIVCDIEDGDFFAYKACHVVGRLERNFTYSEWDDVEIMTVDDADLTRITLEDALMDETLRVRTLSGTVGGWCDRRAVTNVIFVEICQISDKGRRRTAGHKEGGIVVGVADGDVAETIDYLVVIEDVICCNECG